MSNNNHLEELLRVQRELQQEIRSLDEQKQPIQEKLKKIDIAIEVLTELVFPVNGKSGSSNKTEKEVNGKNNVFNWDKDVFFNNNVRDLLLYNRRFLHIKEIHKLIGKYDPSKSSKQVGHALLKLKSNPKYGVVSIKLDHTNNNVVYGFTKWTEAGKIMKEYEPTYAHVMKSKTAQVSG